MSVMQREIELHEARKAAQAAGLPAKREFSDEDKQRALAIMVACGGSAQRASALLAEDGLEVGAATLRSWKRYMRDDYERLRAEMAPRLEAELVHVMRETAIEAARVERKAIELAERKLDNGTDYDPAKTAVSMSRIKATATDRLLTLTGRPQSIVEHRRAEEIMRSLAAKGVIELAPEDVEEIPDAEEAA